MNKSLENTGIFAKNIAHLQIIKQICVMEDFDWNEQAKRLLKSELVRRGITNEELVSLLEAIGVGETRVSIDSKISRGTFSAAFLLQCLNAIGCKNFTAEIEMLSMVEEPRAIYRIKKSNLKKLKDDLQK